MWNKIKSIISIGIEEGLGVDDIADSLIDYLAYSEDIDEDTKEKIEEVITEFAEVSEDVKLFAKSVRVPIQKHLSTQKKGMKYLRPTGEEDEDIDIEYYL